MCFMRAVERRVVHTRLVCGEKVARTKQAADAQMAGYRRRLVVAMRHVLYARLCYMLSYTVRFLTSLLFFCPAGKHSRCNTCLSAWQHHWAAAMLRDACNALALSNLHPWRKQCLRFDWVLPDVCNGGLLRYDVQPT